jgi:hypothetical protein
VNLAQFIEAYQQPITRAVLKTYPPLYSARNRQEWGFDLRRLRRRPMGAQGDAIRAVAVSLQRHRGTNARERGRSSAGVRAQGDPLVPLLRRCRVTLTSKRLSEAHA